MKVAVIGAGWAGLAAAVRATQAGHVVSVFEMAPRPGGRARSDDDTGDALDNGQHILLGGYGRTLALMRDVGVDPGAALLRSPLAVRWPDGTGFALSGRGPRILDAMGSLAQATGLAPADKLALLRSALAWRRAGFECDASLSAADLLRRTATTRLRKRLLDPLCVAALNTPVEEASARVLLAVLRDSLFGERGASDLLIPRVPLGRLLPVPALDWLGAAGAEVRLRVRVDALEFRSSRWRLRARAMGSTVAGDDAGSPGDERTSPAPPEEEFDGVIVATPAPEAARLCGPFAAAWSTTAAALDHEPIATLWLRTPARPWPAAMMALPSDLERRPAQFAFKLARGDDDHEGPGTDHAPGVPAMSLAGDRITLVVSAAAPWVERGLPALRDAAVAQAREAWGFSEGDAIECAAARVDRRATFRCVAGVSRPPAQVAERLFAAGDYVDGTYPATIEAAVRAGEAAAAALSRPAPRRTQ